MLDSDSTASAQGTAAVDETLCRLAEYKKRSVSVRAMHLLNTMRLRQLERMQLTEEASVRVELKLLAFPEPFSQRNFVLVGRRPCAEDTGHRLMC